MGGAQAQPNFRVLLYWCTHPLTQNYQIWRGNSNTYGKKTCYRRSATPPPQGVRRPSASHVGTVARFVSDSCLLCEWSLCVDRCLQICLWGKCLMPWILFRILFKPATIKIFRSWTSEFQYGISAKVSYVNVGIGLCLCLTWIVNVIITRWWVRASRHVTGSVSCYCMPGLASEPQRADHRLGHLASPTCIQVPWPLGDQREGWNTPNMTLWLERRLWRLLLVEIISKKDHGEQHFMSCVDIIYCLIVCLSPALYNIFHAYMHDMTYLYWKWRKTGVWYQFSSELTTSFIPTLTCKFFKQLLSSVSFKQIQIFNQNTVSLLNDMLKNIAVTCKICHFAIQKKMQSKATIYNHVSEKISAT